MGRAEALERVIGGGTGQVAVQVFDGSRAGPADAPVTIDVRIAAGAVLPGHRPAATSGWPGPTSRGDIEVEGDLYTALSTLAAAGLRRCRCGERMRLLRELGGVRLLRRPPLPAAGGPAARPAALQGPRPARPSRTTTTCRTSSTSGCSGPSMAYTCAVYPTAERHARGGPVRQARPGRPQARRCGRACGCSTSGCGWGGMVMHAAQHYGVRALGRDAVPPPGRVGPEGDRRGRPDRAGRGAPPGLPRRAEETEFDAISSIGLTEHIGLTQLPSYFQFLLRPAAPGRPAAQPLHHRAEQRRAGVRKRRFISRYIFPDGELTGVGRIVSHMHDNGFEVRHEENLREHYALTTGGLVAQPGRALGRVRWPRSALAKARVWRLYLAGVAARLRAQRRSSCTRCSASSCTRTAGPTCRCAPTGRVRLL